MSKQEDIDLHSRLVVLKSGQVIGHPVTRRELKRILRQSRLARRAGYRAIKKAGGAK